MQKIQNAYLLFQKIIIAFLTVCFVWIGIGTIKEISEITIVKEQNAGFTFFFGLFLFALLALFIRWGFLWIARHDSMRTQYNITGVLHGLMILIFTILLTQFDVNLRNDAYQDVDAACYLTDHTSIPVDNKHPGELLSFGNNYFFIWMTSKIIRLLFAMGISNIVPYLQGINATAMVLGAFFSWLLVKEMYDIKAANQVLLLCVLNPLFYGFTFWYYSNSLSIPLMMAIPYVAIRIWRTEKMSARLLLSALEGFLLFLGYELRPTAVFPFIAICLIAPFQLLKSEDHRKSFIALKCKQLLPCGLILLIILGISFSSFSHIRSVHFGELLPHNRPITYWLAMGAHGTGNLETNGSDVQFVKSLSDGDNKTLLCLQRAIHHYQKNGIPGTIDLWARKTATVWSDGYGGISRRIISGEAKSPLYALLAGDNKDLFILYCQAFRLLTIVGLFLFCIYSFGKRISAPMFSLVITLLGGIVFYFFWEARAFYSAPFVPVMLILGRWGFSRLFYLSEISEPISALQANTEISFNGQSTPKKNFDLRSAPHQISATPLHINLARTGNKIRWFPFVCCLFITLFVCLDFLYVAGGTITSDHFRIYTKGKPRHYAAIEGKNITDIEQDFYVQKSFNHISLPAKCKEEYNKFSDYRITLSDDEDILYSTIIGRKSVKNNRIKLTFDTIIPNETSSTTQKSSTTIQTSSDTQSADNVKSVANKKNTSNEQYSSSAKSISDGHYTLHIEKLNPEKSDITFFTKYDSYYIDAYEGELTVNDKGNYVNDLGLTVLLHAEKEPYLPKKVRFLFAGLLMLFAMLVAWGNITSCRSAYGKRGKADC